MFFVCRIFVKLGPCLILMVSTILLIMSLKDATKNRLALFEDQSLKNAAVADPSTSKQSGAKDAELTRNNDSHGGDIRNSTKQSNSAVATKEFVKTTKMLIILLILFLVTELPPGILAFCFGLIKSKKFFLQCYVPIRPFLNLNEYVSSSVGFFIYLYMSSKFRQTFIQHFWISRGSDDTNVTLLSIAIAKVRLFPSKNQENSMRISNENTQNATFDCLRHNNSTSY